jgi:hypothetical protein
MTINKGVATTTLWALVPIAVLSFITILSLET